MRRVFALFLSLLMLSSSGLLDIVACATGLGENREATSQEVVGETVSIPVGEIEVEGTEPEKLDAAVYAAKVLDEETMLLYAAIDAETCQIMGYSGEETELIIPSRVGGLTVTAIGNRAFSNSKLESVTLPDTLTYIGQSAFAECKNMTSVRIPDSVTQIDFGAFTHCLNLEDVQLSSQLAYIGRSAFENCEKLECVEIPDSVSEIGFAAFMDCASLSSVTYPVNLQKTGSHIFADCPALKEIEVPEGVTYLPDDVFNGSTLQTVKLPSTLVTIGDQAFFECANLSAIELPNSVTTIGYRSFEKCTGLETVKLSEQLLSIGQSAFNGCSKLESLELPDSLTTIGYTAFQKCTALSSVKYPLGLKTAGTIFTGCTALKHIEVPEGVTALPADVFSDSSLETVKLPSTLEAIGSQAFQNCVNLTSIELPDSVTTIGYRSFEKCTGLETVKLSEQLLSIGQGAFHNCVNLTSIELPDSLTNIGYAAFQNCTALSSVKYPLGLESASTIFTGCTALKHIEVPEGVTALPADVFSDSSLETVKLPSTLETIGSQAFYNCVNLISIELPDSVKSIGYRVFEGCGNLETVKLSEQLLSIGQGAFNGCSKLETLELPDSLTNIGYAAFQNCTALSSVKYPLGLESANTIFTGCTALKYIEVPEGVTALPADVFSDSSLETVKLPSTLVTIGNSAFKVCRDLVSIEIPDSVTSIGRDAFADCGNLQNLKLSQQLLYIGQSAFGDCRKLESVEIPDSVTNIGYSAFQYCTALSSVKYPLCLQSAGGAIFAGCTSLKHIEVPEGVTVLPGDVFSASELETVKLPSTLVTIGSSAFEGSRNLVSIEIPDSVTSIGYKSFCDCANLKSVKLPRQLLTIGQSAFDDCRSLESVSIPEGVTSIGYAAFRTCLSLTSANYPGSLQSTGGSVFHDCSSLKYMEFGEGLTSIGWGEFAYCYSLETVLLPDSVRSIGRDAFTGCRNLRAIGLSQNLNSIDREAFEGCLSLTDVTVPNSVTSIGREAFAGVPGLVFYCDLQSYAAAYAVENGIPIVEIAASQESPNAVLDKANSYYEINYGGISASGDLSMVAKYQLKDGADANPDQMIFYFPQSVKLKEETLTVNGEPCVSFTFEEDEGLLYVPVSGSEGIVRFMLEPVRYDTVTAYAKLRYSGNGRYNTEVVGTVYTELNLLNISAMSQTAQNFVNVSGVAAPEAEIRLYVDGVYTKSVKANKVGDYNTTVTLPDPSDGKQYTITASTDGISDQLYAVTTVKYYTDTPTMTDFVMEYNGNTYSMEELNGKKPVVRFDTREKFKFTIRFDGVSNIDRLWVVSTRSNREKAIEAKWDPAINAYVAEGWFDPDDHTYVPGKISIRMSRKSDKLTFDSEIDFTADKYVNQLTSDWQGATAELIENSETGSTVHIQLDGLELDLSTNVRPIPEGMTQVSLEREGYIRYEDENGYAVYVRTYDKPDEAGMVVVDFVKGQITDYFVGQVIESAVGGTVGGVISLLQGQKALEKANQEFKLMRQDIMNNPNLSDFEKRIAIQRVNDAETINTLAAYGQFTCTFLGIVGGIVGMSTGVGIALVVGGLIFSAIQTQNQHKMNTFMYNLQFGLRFAIDPSGYVYDSKTKQRLPGVTTTAYWIPFDEEVENFWDAVPEPDVYGEVWDATEFSQINPMTTDNDGCYAWDVPEGWWRVKYEKEGYETTWSEWLPVPPPQTEVNIGMVCLNAAVTMLGDVDLDEDVDVDDVLALLWYVLFPEEYPIAVDADFDHNESTDVDDVLTLLWYVLFPEEYPLS